MFQLARYGGVMRVGTEIAPTTLEPAVDEALDRVWKETAPDPTVLHTLFGWAAAVKVMEATWLRR
jgi:hypothetical protein